MNNLIRSSFSVPLSFLIPQLQILKSVFFLSSKIIIDSTSSLAIKIFSPFFSILHSNGREKKLIKIPSPRCNTFFSYISRINKHWKFESSVNQASLKNPRNARKRIVVFSVYLHYRCCYCKNGRGEAKHFFVCIIYPKRGFCTWQSGDLWRLGLRKVQPHFKGFR